MNNSSSLAGRHLASLILYCLFCLFQISSLNAHGENINLKEPSLSDGFVSLSASELALLVDNPDLIIGPCENLDVILILDESGSISSPDDNIVRNATLALAQALQAGGGQLAIIEFSSASSISDIDGAGPGAAGYRTVNPTYVAELSEYLFPGGNNPPLPGTSGYIPSGNTNWEAAFDDAISLNSSRVADLIIFLTDGNPTAYVNPDGSICSPCSIDAVSQAIPKADLIKSAGSHMFALAIGSSINLSNISAVTGPEQDLVPGNADGLLPTTADYANIPFSELEACFNDIIVESCSPTINLEKTVYLGHDSGASFPGNELVAGINGAAVTYCFEISNSGDTDLALVAFQDAILGIDESDLSLISGSWPLAPGGTITYYFETTIEGSIQNSASIQANPVDEQGNGLGLSNVIDFDTASVEEIDPCLACAQSDEEAPVFAVCPSDQTLNSVVGSCFQNALWSEPSEDDLIDNCLPECPLTLEGPFVSFDADADTEDIDLNILVIDQGDIAFSSFPVGTRYVKYRATDQAGNISYCIFSITVIDTEDPDIYCPGDFELVCNTSDLPDYTGLVLSLDNCELSSITQEPAPGASLTSILGGTPSHGESFLLTWIATDASGNSAGCSTSITISDVTPPSIICPPDVDVPCGGDTSPLATGKAGGSDDCGVVFINYTESISPACGSTITIARTWTVHDEAGNTSSCLQYIYVVDNTPPTLEVNPDAEVECGQAFDLVGFNVSDDCSETSVTIDSLFTPSDGACGVTFLPGATTNGGTWLEEQALKEQMYAQGTSAPTDEQEGDNRFNMNPPLNDDICSALSIATGVINTTNSEATPDGPFGACWFDTSTENNVWYQFDPTTSGLYELETFLTGSNDDTQLSVYTSSTGDCSGNLTEIACNDDIDVAASNYMSLLQFNASVGESYFIQVDGWQGAEGEFDLSLSAVSDNSCLGAGTWTITYTATDDCGNTTVLNQEIEVLDSQSPTISIGQTEASLSCGEFECGLDQLIAFKAGELTIPERQALRACVVGEFELAGITPTGVEDNCSCEIDWEEVDLSVLINENCEDGALAVVRCDFQATDDCGNTSSIVSSFLSIVDTTPPTIQAADDMDIQCNYSIPEPEWTADDDCGTVDVSIEQSITGGCGNTFTLTRTYTATDLCGNTATDLQIVQVIDTIAPQIFCPDSVVVACGESTEPVSTGKAFGQDDCGPVTVNHSDEAFEGQCAADMDILRTWVVRDECGNSSTCEQYIYVRDLEAPNFDSQASDLELECGDENNDSSIADWLENHAGASASDACGDVTITNNYAEGTCGVNYSGTWDDSDPTFLAGDCWAFEVNPPQLSYYETLEFSISVAGEYTFTMAPSDQYDGIAAVYENSFDPANTCQNLIGGDDDLEPDQFETEPSLTVTLNLVPGNYILVSATWNELGTGEYFWNFEGPAPLVIDCSGCSENTGTTTVAFTATDDCGNTSSTFGRIIINDTTAPEIITEAIDESFECGDGDFNVALQDWLSDNGGAVASDFCSDVSWSNNYCGDELVTRTVDLGANWIGFMNAFESEANGGAQVLATPWAVEDLISILDAGSNTITLKPNRIDDLSPEWNSGTALGERIMDANTYVDDNSLLGQAFTFSGEVLSNDLDASYEEFAFIRVFNGDFSQLLVELRADLIPGQTFSLTYDNSNPDGANVQYGFSVIGSNVNPDPQFDEFYNSLGNVVVTDASCSLSDECGETGDVTVTFIATDDCGNASSTEATFSIIDTTPPTLEVGANAIVECGDPLPEPFSNASDDCGEVFVTLIESEVPGCGQTYTLTRTYTATDECGNTSTATQTITEVDTTAPSIVCPVDVTIQCDESTMPVNTGKAFGADGCGFTTVNHSDQYFPGDCPGESTIIRTWTVRDQCENEVSCDQIITIVDTVAPVFTSVPEDVTLSCGEVIFPVNDQLCDAIELTVNADFEFYTNSFAFAEPNEVPGSCFGGSGTIQSVWFSFEGPATGEATVSTDFPNTELHDTQIAVYTLSGDCNDQSSLVEIGCDEDGGSAEPFGFTSIVSLESLTPGETYYVKVDSWNDAEGEFAIQVLDFLISTPLAGSHPSDQEKQSQPQASASRLVLGGYPTAFDNCSGTVINADALFTEACGESGIWSITYTATDNCGNTAVHIQTVTLVDTTPPVFVQVPDDITLECDEDLPSDMLSDYSEGVEYNGHFYYKSNALLTWSEANAAAQSLGGYLVTINDEAENDFLYNTFYLPSLTDLFIGLNDINTENEFEWVNGEPLDYTNWDGGEPNDLDGEDAVHMIFGGVWNDISEFNTYYYVVESDSPLGSELVVEDNCSSEVVVTTSEVFEEGDCIGNGIRTITYTAIDECQNTSTATRVITIVDTTAPVVLFAQDSVQVECTEFACDYADMLNYQSLSIPERVALRQCVVGQFEALGLTPVGVEDNCSINLAWEEVDLDIEVYSPCVNGITVAITCYFQSTDDCGNLSEIAASTMYLYDNTPPAIYCPADMTVECGESTMPVQTGKASAGYECGLITINYSDSFDSSCGLTGVITRTWIATDACGNVSTCDQIITIEDTTDPVFVNPPANTTAECDDVPAPLDIEVSDNCGSVDVDYDEILFSGGCEGTLERTWIITDECGNSNIHIQYINLIDTTAPVLSRCAC